MIRLVLLHRQQPSDLPGGETRPLFRTVEAVVPKQAQLAIHHRLAHRPSVDRLLGKGVTEPDYLVVKGADKFVEFGSVAPGCKIIAKIAELALQFGDCLLLCLYGLAVFGNQRRKVVAGAYVCV